MARNRLIAVLIIVASGVFALGVTLERSEEDGESPAHVEAEAEGEHIEGEEAEGIVEETHDDEGEESETLLGIDLESTPLVVLAVLGSLALAGALWLRPDLGWLLAVTGIAMLAFAVLDVREVLHQMDEANDELAVLAGVVAALHLAAAGLAFQAGSNANPRAGVESPPNAPTRR